MTEIHLLFYQAVLQLFVHFNMFLQREDPLIPIIYKQMNSFLTKLAGKFLPVSSIRGAKGDFFNLKYQEKEDHLPGDDLSYIWLSSHIILFVFTYRQLHFCWNYDEATVAETA